MTFDSWAWLGARAAQRLGSHGAVEIMAPPRVERRGLIGRVEIHAPLTDAEFARLRDTFAFEFADDHRAFLAAGLPLGRGWPDWRHGSIENLCAALTSPVLGALFDVEHNGFWYHGWGARPADAGARRTLAQRELARVPQMVPIYGHRYLPAGGGASGHPVLSINQTDVICYGTDLVDYVFQEFGAGSGLERTDPRWHPRPTVDFWSALIQ